MTNQKKCSCCHRTLPVDSFWKAKGSFDGLQGYCKDCAKMKRAKYQKDHPEKMRDYAKKHWRKYREKMVEYDKNRVNVKREFINTLKTPCVKCGEPRLWVIQFHHINPDEKGFGIGDGSNPHKSKESVIQEVKKCVCLCANCHREFHHFYGQKPPNPVESINEYLNGGDDL